MAERRYDAGSLRPAKRLGDGRLRVDAALTRTGVFVYLNSDGTERREYRPADEVFHVDSLASFEGVTFTDDHPSVPVTPENAKALAVGWLGETLRRDGDHLIAPIYVADAEVIRKIEAGKREVSCGYDCDLEMVAGVTESGERYDAIQRNIRGNHVALVDRGRAGTARVSMDGAAVMVTDERGNEPTEDQKMEELQSKLDAALARADQAEAALKDVECKLAAVEGERDAAAARADQAERARQDAADVLTSRVNERVALVGAALKVLGDVRLDTMSDREVRCAVIEKITGKAVDAARSDEYVAARFDSALERAEEAREATASLRSSIEVPAAGARADVADEDAARAKLATRRANAWKEGC